MSARVAVTAITARSLPPLPPPVSPAPALGQTSPGISQIIFPGEARHSLHHKALSLSTARA